MKRYVSMWEGKQVGQVGRSWGTSGAQVGEWGTSGASG